MSQAQGYSGVPSSDDVNATMGYFETATDQMSADITASTDSLAT